MNRLVLGIIPLMLIVPLILWASGENQQYYKVIGQLRLAVPTDAGDQSYLGIRQKSGQFGLVDVDAEIIIVEIFSMYCPHCQRHAPEANKLYQEIMADRSLAKKVKVLGIGVGNSPFEVKFFRKKYSVPFPLFDDANSAVLNSLTGIQTPTYFGLKNDGRTLTPFFMQQGPYDDAKVFLQTVLRKAGAR
ncbi:MAG TPA: redoxin domain-containing protein [Deltaproteobacteria bacterium]|nr:redoxin domain-containing protein [Deltaproteobacteria bacterium]HQI80250.1 redoxin domain-containing protein [Deltaproteobacteria bacterium]